MGNFLRPSNAHAWVRCHGQPRMVAHLPPEAAHEDDSEAAREGTAAHWAASVALSHKGRLSEIRLPGIAPNGVSLTEALIDSASIYVDHIVDNFMAFKWHVEEFITIPAIHPHENEGTPDFWCYDQGTFTVHIVDFKNGHAPVEVFEIWQLIDYAAGITDLFPHAGTHVEFTIVQPCARHVDGIIRTWRVSVADLQPYFQTLREAAYAAFQPDAQLNVGPHCDHCDAAAYCPALYRAAANATDRATAATIFDLTPEQAGVELRMLQRASRLLDARKDALETQAVHMLRRGDRVPFFKMEQGSGRERWTVDEETVVAMGTALGLNLAKPTKALTPRQAVAAGLPPEFRAELAETPRGEMKLVPDNGAKARQLFK